VTAASGVAGWVPPGPGPVASGLVAARAASRPRAVTARPAAASARKWLAVAITTRVVAEGESQARWRSRPRVAATRAAAHQADQATCRLGIAAYRLTRLSGPCGLPALRIP